MISDKISVQFIIQYLKHLGVKEVVISPGSRNAPFILSFTQDAFFNCTSIIDERSAGFIALGKAKRINKPVVIVCTSGSAALNYSPAIVEAYYQNIPLIVLTADRPENGVSTGAGQCFNQAFVFQNFVQLSVNIKENDDEKVINEKLSKVDEVLSQYKGPVHLNTGFEEPLYNLIESPLKLSFSYQKNGVSVKEDYGELYDKLHHYKRKLIILLEGTCFDYNALLELYGHDKSIYILAENTANTGVSKFNHCIDRTIFGVDFKNYPELKPDLIITVGKNLISKKIRQLLSGSQTIETWAFDNPYEQDFFNQKSKFYQSFNDFLKGLSNTGENIESDYQLNWETLALKRKKSFLRQLDNTPFSDLWSMSHLISNLKQVDLFLGNSTSIRYGNLIDYNSTITYHGNRGVSGIDGCSSTAVGFASLNARKTVLITGDLGFIYDQHALWNNLAVDITIFVLNNGKGDIFNIIDGPSKHPESLPFFTTPHQLNLKHIATQYGASYYQAKDKESLINISNEAIEIKGVSIVDIKTSEINNSQELNKVINQIQLS